MNTLDKKVITTLTNEQLQLFKDHAVVIKDDNDGNTYYHLPFFFKDLGYNEFEIMGKDTIPEWVKDLIQSEIP